MYTKENVISALTKFGEFSEATLQNVSDFLENVPADHWTAPSSSSGKYHPSFDHGEGGSVRHSVMCAYYVDRFARFYDLSQYAREVTLVAAFLHDTYKGGRGAWTCTVMDHGEIAAAELRSFAEKLSDSERGFFYDVALAVETHMSWWREQPTNPRMMNNAQICLATADYAAAQKIFDEVDQVIGYLEAN